MESIAAIFDSDFIIKTYNTVNTKNEHLCDIVCRLPYSFFCHEQILTEMKRHCDDATIWIENKIAAGEIKKFTDLDILLQIKNFYKCSVKDATKFYSDYLKQACDIFSKAFFATYYKDLIKLSAKPILTEEEFTETVKSGDASVGIDNDLGEIKDVVLSLFMNDFFSCKSYHFCSDDGRARKNLLGFIVSNNFPLNCISFMGVFFIAKEKGLLCKEEQEDFLSNWKIFCSDNGVGTNIRIKKNIKHNSPDYQVLDIDFVFEEIWNNNLILGVDGFLFYRNELH